MTTTPRSASSRFRRRVPCVELANQTLGATGLEREMFHRLDRLVRRVPVGELHYTDLPEAITAVERLGSGAPPIGRLHEDLAR